LERVEEISGIYNDFCSHEVGKLYLQYYSDIKIKRIRAVITKLQLGKILDVEKWIYRFFFREMDWRVFEQITKM